MISIALNIIFAAVAAPHPSYGGQLTVHAWGTSGALSPTGAKTLAERLLTASIYEPLFSYNQKGQIEGALVESSVLEKELKLHLTLRKNIILHNGKTLSVEDVINAFRDLARPDSRAQHIVWPIKGAREHAQGNAKAEFGVSKGKQPGEIIIQLEYPYPHIKRLLAGLNSAIRVGVAGTGPFMKVSKNKSLLRGFKQYRHGAPYVAALKYKTRSSGFAVRSALRRQEAELAFGLPDIDKQTAKRVKQWQRPGTVTKETIILRVGPKLKTWRKPETLQILSHSIKRRRLSRRFFPGNSKPVTNLLHQAVVSARTPRRQQQGPAKTLLLATESAPSLRFAERVQFDLLRAGVSVKIERLPSDHIAKRKQSGAYDFILESITLMPTTLQDEVSVFHKLIEFAARLAVLESVITPKQMSAFSLAPTDVRLKLLSEIDNKIRESAGIIPIAERDARIWVSKRLHYIPSDAERRLPFENLELTP